MTASQGMIHTSELTLRWSLLNVLSGRGEQVKLGSAMSQKEIGPLFKLPCWVLCPASRKLKLHQQNGEKVTVCDSMLDHRRPNIPRLLLLGGAGSHIVRTPKSLYGGTAPWGGTESPGHQPAEWTSPGPSDATSPHTVLTIILKEIAHYNHLSMLLLDSWFK